MSSDSTVKILRKHDVKESDQLPEDVKGVVLKDDALGLSRYAINVDAVHAIFKEAAKITAGVGVGK